MVRVRAAGRAAVAAAGQRRDAALGRGGGRGSSSRCSNPLGVRAARPRCPGTSQLYNARHRSGRRGEPWAGRAGRRPGADGDSQLRQQHGGCSGHAASLPMEAPGRELPAPRPRPRDLRARDVGEDRGAGRVPPLRPGDHGRATTGSATSRCRPCTTSSAPPTLDAPGPRLASRRAISSGERAAPARRRSCRPAGRHRRPPPKQTRAAGRRWRRSGRRADSGTTSELAFGPASHSQGTTRPGTQRAQAIENRRRRHLQRPVHFRLH